MVSALKPASKVRNKADNKPSAVELQLCSQVGRSRHLYFHRPLVAKTVLSFTEVDVFIKPATINRLKSPIRMYTV